VPPPVIRTLDVTKDYHTGSGIDFFALKGVSVDIEQGEFTAVMGPSGSGKTTFMNIIGCLDRHSGGRYEFLGKDVSSHSIEELAKIRNQYIGFIFQNFNLLPRYSALDNVALPCLYADKSREQARRDARQALERVGLAAHAEHRPTEMSGGQQQRVAIARALVNSPSLLLADEPTGNLDSATSEEVMALLVELNSQSGTTVVLVTHEPDIARHARRQIRFRDGYLVSDSDGS
jgi:putative ABC transport system ATP-binding protein